MWGCWHLNLVSNVLVTLVMTGAPGAWSPRTGGPWPLVTSSVMREYTLFPHTLTLNLEWGEVPWLWYLVSSSTYYRYTFVFVSNLENLAWAQILVKGLCWWQQLTSHYIPISCWTQCRRGSLAHCLCHHVCHSSCEVSQYQGAVEHYNPIITASCLMTQASEG